MDGNVDDLIRSAKKISARLIKRNARVASAISRRDVCLYRYFEAILEVDGRLRKMGKPKEVKRALKDQYGITLPASNNPAMLAVKLTYPTLAPKACSKYAAALRFVHRKKKPNQTVRKFMKAHGGINGCEREEKKSRPPKRNPGKPRTT